MINGNTEFQVIKDFERILGLENKTDGTLFIYKGKERSAKKPDGYFYLDGVTFILDAKARGKKFEGQLEDYMIQEINPKYIGFKYNGDTFECYIQGKLAKTETEPKNAAYYVENYLSKKITSPEIVSKETKNLANYFRKSGINKQHNVPFIGSVMLCLKYKKRLFLGGTTNQLLMSIKEGIETIIADEPVQKKEKKDYLINKVFEDDSIKRAKISNLIHIISTIHNIHNFINVSEKSGQDTMNSFLKIFRKWNSADSQEKGEVFTPDHIAELMINLVNLNINDTVLDPTCGSGTFLTNALFHLLSKTNNPEKQEQIKRSKIIGIELDEFNATLAGINMLLHGDGSSQIFKTDCFSQLPLMKCVYNKVLMNPPFSIQIPELNFVEAALDNCAENGVVASILPLTVIKEIKNSKILKKHTLRKVVTLNRKLFLPNAAVWTGIVVFETHRKHTKTDFIKTFNYEEDGYELLRGKNGRYKINEAPFDYNNYESRTIDQNLNFYPKFQGKLDFERKLREYYSSLFLNKIQHNFNLNIKQGVEQLDNVDWHEFNILDLFNIENGMEKNSKDDEVGVPLITAKKINEGIGGYKSNPIKIFHATQKNAMLAVVCGGDGGSGKTYAKTYDFSAVKNIRILIAKSSNPMNENIANFIALSCSVEWFGKYGHGKTLNPESEFVRLPGNSNGPDFEFMDKYIAKILQ